MGGYRGVFRPGIHAFPENPLVELLGDQVHIGKIGLPYILVDDAVRNMLQLQAGRCRILDGDAEKATGLAVFDEEILSAVVFFFLEMEGKKERRRGGFRGGAGKIEEIGEQHPSPSLGLQGPENHLHAVAEMTVIKRKTFGGIDTCIDHDPIKAQGGELRGQIRVDLSSNHDVGRSETALFHHLVDEQLGEGVQVSKDADIGQVDHKMVSIPAHQGNAEGCQRRLRLPLRRFTCFPCRFVPDQVPDHAADITLHPSSPSIHLLSVSRPHQEAISRRTFRASFFCAQTNASSTLSRG